MKYTVLSKFELSATSRHEAITELLELFPAGEKTRGLLSGALDVREQVGATIVHNNIAHLRIENRYIPSGPSIKDEIANSMFWVGVMLGMPDDYKNIWKRMEFKDARGNFIKAARTGMDTYFNWFNKGVSATVLAKDVLLPLAHKGLIKANVDPVDIKFYLNIIEQRIENNITGSKWLVRSSRKLQETVSREEANILLTYHLHKNQKENTPVHEWPLAKPEKRTDWRAGFLLVGQFMTTKLLTVRPDDSMDLAASIMDWKRVRHVPVENDEGELVGLVSHRSILKKIVDGDDHKATAISEIMNEKPLFAEPKTTTVEAIQIMRDKRISCLPVVDNGKLAGVITEYDLIKIASHVLEADLKAYKKQLKESE